MQLTTSNSLFASALVAGALLTSPAQAQSAQLSQYKLQVGTTLVLGETAQEGNLRILNNGPANTEVRWFDPKAGSWDSQVLEAGESLLGERGSVVRISKDTLVCLLGQASKDKAGQRNTNGYFSLALVAEVDKEEVEEKSSKDGESKSKPASKSKPEVKTKGGNSKTKPASKSKPEVKTKGGESKSIAALIDEDGDGGDDSGNSESTGITFEAESCCWVIADAVRIER